MRNLKQLRLEKGFNQMEMANEFDMPPSTYQQYEAGINEPKFSTLIQIADYFNVSIDYLIGRTNIREPWDGANDRVSAEIARLPNSKARQALLTLLREISPDESN